jgi:RNA polymerase sigma-70 factor (ECF subfamily)
VSDALYIQKTLDGDQEAFRFLVEKYQNMVFTVALRIVKHREDAEEVAQDTFIKAYQKLNTFQGGSKLSTWLYSIAYNTAISRTRKKTYDEQDIDDLGDHAAIATSNSEQLNALNQDEQKRYLTQALAKLPEQDAAVLTLYYLEEQSVEEVSDITGLSRSNVKVKLHRSRQKLQIELEKLLRGELKTMIQ